MRPSEEDTEPARMDSNWQKRKKKREKRVFLWSLTNEEGMTELGDHLSGNHHCNGLEML